MKVIKTIVENIEEETDGAENYAKLATQYKETDKLLADTYAKLAGVELDHVNLLHDQVVRIIKDWKATSGKEVPTSMQAVWDYEHQRSIDKVAKIKALLEIYKRP